jgi:hypothetical protein
MDCEVIDVWYCFSAEAEKRMVAWISKSNSDRNRRDKTKFGFFTDIFPL